ncbi:MAG: hypothetical protein ACXWZJ_06835 [Solirubrobacterales bacterium]
MRTTMRRSLATALVLACTLAFAAAALAGPAATKAAPGGAGHNAQTRALEAVFKVALYLRAGDPKGCYPTPDELIPEVRAQQGTEVLAAASLKKLALQNRVYAIKRAIKCNRVQLGLRVGKKTYVLDSARGPVFVIGPGSGGAKGGRHGGNEPGQAGPLRAIRLVTKSFPAMTKPDQVDRLTVNCPAKSYPFGGGLSASPAPGPDGEGVYPHSYERLGVQRGFHSNPVMIDPSPAETKPRKVTLQVMCGKGLVPTAAPHKTVFLLPGQTKQAVARCPKGTQLFSGGFQRTDIRTPGGDYVTESRAIGTRAWRVSGRAFGLFGGELTAIAHCVNAKRPLMTEVSASTSVAAGQSGEATTPRCPKGARLLTGGFSFNGTHQGLYADGIFESNGAWTASAFGYFGAVPKLTAYGYCLRPGDAG